MGRQERRGSQQVGVQGTRRATNSSQPNNQLSARPSQGHSPSKMSQAEGHMGLIDSVA